MKTALHRRGFLQAAGLAAAGSLMPEVRAGAQPAEAVPQRPPRLIPGCCAYSYGELLEPGKMTMEEFILKAVELEVVGVDMTAYWLKSTEPAYLHSLRRLAFRHGIAFSGAACGVEMCEADAGKRAAHVTEITKWVDAAELLGASHLRVFGGVLPHGATAEQGKDWVVEVMKPACEYAARKGVTVGMESHGGITGEGGERYRHPAPRGLTLRRVQPGYHPLPRGPVQPDRGFDPLRHDDPHSRPL